MIYWLNRRVERALVGYLTKTLPGEYKAYRSCDLTPRQFPCAVARVYQVMRFKGEIHACNRMLASIMVMTEFARVVDDDAKLIEEFEETEEKVVSAVMESFYIDDLATQLTAINIDGLSISYAALGGDGEYPVTSQLSEDGTVSIVEIPLVIHAGATEI